MKRILAILFLLAASAASAVERPVECEVVVPAALRDQADRLDGVAAADEGAPKQGSRTA